MLESLKRQKHSNIPKGQLKEKFPKNLITEKELGAYSFEKEEIQGRIPNIKFGGIFFKEEIAVEEKRKRVWVIST